MQNKYNWIKYFILVGFLSAICLTPAMAQDQASTTDSKVDYSNNELESFIIANVGIYQLQQQVSAQMPNMESDQQKEELMQAANQQMEQVLNEVGLTPDEYNAMGQAIQSDAQLQEKVRSIATDLSQQNQPEQQ
jgi:Domain of unknown function (DUF4168)